MTKLYRQGKKRRMTKFRIDELAAVDRPAQEPALARIFKRRDGAPVEKVYRVALMTTEVDGHAHNVNMYDGELGGETSWNTSEGKEQGHSHPWALDPSTGRLVVGASEGHTHEVDAAQVTGALLVLSKSLEKKGIPCGSPQVSHDRDRTEVPMTDQEKQALEKRLARAEALAQLNDAEKAYLKTLSEPDAAAFLALTPGGRAAELVKAAEANPIVYTATDGSVFRKNDDPRLVAQAKRADEAEKLAKAEREARESERLTKRAETELRHYPGDVAARAALLKAVESITDEAQRKAVLEALTAGDTALSKAFQVTGTTAASSDPTLAKSAEAQLDALVKAHMKEKGVSQAAAYDAVLQTEQGRTLYSEYTKARGAAN